LAKSLTVLPNVFTTLAEKFRAVQILDGLALLQRFLNQAKTRYGAVLGWAMRIVFSGLVCTPLFMQFMGVFQILSLDTVGVPGQRTYRLALAAYALVTLRGFLKAHWSGALYLPKPHRHVVAANKTLFGVISAFYAVNAWIAFTADSTKHISTGCHQEFGPSHVVKDVMGFDREDHLGREGPKTNSQSDYRLATPADGALDASGTPVVVPQSDGPASQWYSAVGVPRKDREGDIRLGLLMTSVGVVAYGTALLNVLAWKPAYLN